MIYVEYQEVRLGITKKMADNMPLFDELYKLSPKACTRATLLSDLHTLFIALMHKYGTTEAINMIQLSLEGIVEDYENSKITHLDKETKDHD